jgi:hypothetical protein
MKTKDAVFEDLEAKCCKLKYYRGSLRQFANGLLTKGRGDGEVCRICEVSSAIIDDMKSAGLKLHSIDIVVTQRQVFKYRNHPKTIKGANIPVEDYGIVEAALKNPTNIYEDTVQKHLVYVYTHPYHDDRLVKVVVEPNYRSHGTVMNLAKSWGIVEKCKMNGIQYRKIK